MLFLRRLSKLASWCSIVHIAVGICLSIIVVILNAEARKAFNCLGRSVKAEDWCFSKYKHTYDFPLPYVYFVFLNFGLPYIVTLIYSFYVRNCDGKVNLVYLVLQLFFGTLLTGLQHGVFYPKGYEKHFNCTFPSTEPQFELTYKYAVCENRTSSNNDVVMFFVSLVNVTVALISLIELVRILRRQELSFRDCIQWMVSLIWSRDLDDNIYCFRIRIKGKDIKWMKRSSKHRYILEQLVQTLKHRSSAVKKIGIYYVCFENRFRIGKGSNGTEVFVGLGKDGLEVAVKRLDLNLSFLSRDEMKITAENEIKFLTLPKLSDNQHVLNYRYYVEKKKYAYLVLDLQEENLKEYIDSTERSLAELQHKGPSIFKQILQGIDQLHDENILHRDLKPQNILVTSESKMVLADFGICRRLQENETSHESYIRGTAGWMAKESLPNEDDEDLPDNEIRVRYKKQSDVQVLEMLFYFVLTKGKHPFGKIFFNRLTNITRGVFDLTKLTDPVAKDLIEWMIQHDFTKRPTVKKCFKHPYLISPEENFALLRAVGNVSEIKKKDPSSNVAQELNQEDSLTTPSWRDKIDEEVYTYFSAFHKFKYGDDVTDLLRFIRNAAIHWTDEPRPPSVQQKDVQVPVCPLCNKPVPVNRGEPPDIKVGEHIDRDCQSDPAKEKRKLNSNRCSAKGCKKKELVPVLCDACRRNYCLRHRHPQDHDCATARAANNMKSKNRTGTEQVDRSKPQQTSLSFFGRDLDRARRERANQSSTSRTVQQQPNITRQPGQQQRQQPLSEDEALALAIQASLSETSSDKSTSTTKPTSTQEEEDRALAQAIADSEKEARNSGRRQQANQKQEDKSCIIS